MDTGKVSEEFGHFSGNREVTQTPGEVMGLDGLRPPPLPLVLLGLGEVAGPLLLFSPPRNPS